VLSLLCVLVCIPFHCAFPQMALYDQKQQNHSSVTTGACPECNELIAVAVSTPCHTICHKCFYKTNSVCSKCKLPLIGHARFNNSEATTLFEVVAILRESQQKIDPEVFRRIDQQLVIYEKTQACKTPLSFEDLYTRRMVDLALRHVKGAFECLRRLRILGALKPKMTVAACFRQNDPMLVDLANNERAMEAVSRATGLPRGILPSASAPLRVVHSVPQSPLQPSAQLAQSQSNSPVGTKPDKHKKIAA
jgi:hypothetical protein